MTMIMALSPWTSLNPWYDSMRLSKEAPELSRSGKDDYWPSKECFQVFGFEKSVWDEVRLIRESFSLKK